MNTKDEGKAPLDELSDPDGKDSFTDGAGQDSISDPDGKDSFSDGDK